MSKFDLFKKLANLDENTGESRIVDKAEFIGEYADLYFTNGGDWCRRSLFSKEPNNYKFATAKGTGKINLLWDADDDEKASVEEYFKKNCDFKKSHGICIKYFKSFGKFESSYKTRAIRKDILEYYKTKSCVNCGSNAELQCDHKNGLYNDPRVLNLETQTLDDFQSLCRHCNCQKRQVEKKTRETGKRYGATNIPLMRPFGIDYIEGNETMDVSDPNALKGTYWYDPIAFTTYIHMQHQQLPNHSDTNLIDKMAKMSISKKK